MYRKPYSRTRLIFRPTWCTLHFVNLKKQKTKSRKSFLNKTPTGSLKGAPRRHVSQTLLENTLNFSPNVVYLAFREFKKKKKKKPKNLFSKKYPTGKIKGK